VFFTVVIPTRNRPELGLIALKSALRQDFDDFEVVVSDNSSPEAADRLRAMVAAIADPRVRYVRPPEELAMGEHWEFAVAQARGEFVGVLTDRMAFKKDALARLALEIKTHRPQVISYSSSALMRDAPPFKLQRPAFSGRLETYESAVALKLFSLSILPWGIPAMLNTFVSRALLDEMRSVYPDIYAGAAPDLSFCMHTLDHVARFHYLDVPVMIAHGGGVSNGRAVALGRANEASSDFAATIQSRGGLMFAPIPDVLANHNVIINEYCRVKAVQRSGRFLELDLRRYCDRLDLELEAQGKRPDSADRLRVEAFRKEHGLAKGTPPVASRLKRAVRSAPAKRIALAASDLLGVNPTNRPIGSFSGIEDALAFDEAHPPQPNSRDSGFLRALDRVEAEAAGIKIA
jgi:glycosyltransferase involved in cell wall biosynthesis